MRALLERSGLARATVVAMSAVCVLGLVHAAGAENNIGLRLVALQSPPEQAEPVQPVPVLTVQRRSARPSWAGGRPFHHTRRRGLSMSRRPKATRMARAPKSVVVRIAAEPRLTFLPPPTKPAIVSIYADRTLRRGDAVMLADGVHVFRGTGAGPFRRSDFARLSVMAGLDLHLRRTLDAFDHNPPTRWSSLDSNRV